MIVTAINGSPHKDGNIGIALNLMAEELQAEGIEVKTLHIGRELLHGCIGCGYCFTSENNLCVFANDVLNENMLQMREADGIILGSPTYYGGIAGTMKCFLDRAFFASSSSEKFRNKVGTAVVSARRAGGTEVYNQLNNYFNLAETVPAPSQYWVIGYGMEPGEIKKDAEGIQTIQKNAKGMAWLLKALKAGKNSVLEPKSEKQIQTNFIR